MSKSDRSYRIKTKIGSEAEQVIQVPLQQDIDFLEILSLKLYQEDLYKLHSSNYGVVVGRVLANDGFGIPNVRLSVFIKVSDEDTQNPSIFQRYPYTNVISVDSDNRRYNLLPDEKHNDCYRVVGTFPSKRLVLDDNTQLEIYDKYWKYTTVTNSVGDYMIFGVPKGNQTIHADVDLSNIGVLSQSPRDFIYKGSPVTAFDNARQFKESTNLDNLTQILGQNQVVDVYSFWGDEDAGDTIAITRCDINMAYKFEPSCVFIGSIITDDQGNSISHECAPSKKEGYNRTLAASQGTIEMIRETTDGLVEEFQIDGNELIDGDGVWCYQIPMNLDYVVMDEIGNIIPTDNPTKGVPTRTSVRFRFSVNETGDEGVSRHRAEYLVPNNPMPDTKPKGNWTGNTSTTSISKPQIKSETWRNFDKNYEFGSATPKNCFRSLYWNKVYSVKNYIPRIQGNDKFTNEMYTGIRTTNYYEKNSPFPFNNVRFKISASYMFLCILMEIFFVVAAMMNAIISLLSYICIGVVGVKIFGIKLYWCPFGFLECITLDIEDDEAGDGSVRTYAPGCYALNRDKSWIIGNMSSYTNRVQRALAQESELVNFDFYNDWINGCLYLPLWFWKKTKRKKYFFGLWSKPAVNKFCNASETPKKLFLVQCAPTDIYQPDGFKKNVHKTASSVRLKYGVIYEKTNREGLKIYYYTPSSVTDLKGASYPFVRLFATDIILLGSIADCDLDSMPKMFDRVPATTVNVPFMVSTKVYSDDQSESEDTISTTTPISITGMDWGSKEGSPPKKLAGGMLMDLACASVVTYHKSIINTRRLCELGVTYDSTYERVAVQSNGTIVRREMEPDGMVTRLEIDDTESRAMFATLNHNGLDDLVYSPVTKYTTYRLRYVYPIDFDGQLKETAPNYTSSKNLENVTYDNPNLSYLSFRFGTDGNFRWGYNKTFPMYNNSFYFYFGLTPGKTSLEKFYENFYATCFNNSKEPFAFTVFTRPGGWCRQNAHLEVDIDRIRTPYSFVIKDSLGSIFIEDSDLTYQSLTFDLWEYEEDNMLESAVRIAKASEESGGYGYTLEDAAKSSGTPVTKMDKEEQLDEFLKTAIIDPGFIKKIIPEDATSDGSYHYYSADLVNGMYTIEITDSYGRKIEQEVNLMQENMNVDIATKNLSDAYTVGNPVDFESSGKIVIGSFTIDGFEYRIIQCSDVVQLPEEGAYEITLHKVIDTLGGAGEVPNYAISEDEEDEAKVILRFSNSNIQDDPNINGFLDTLFIKVPGYPNCGKKEYDLVNYSEYFTVSEDGSADSNSKCMVFYPIISDEFLLSGVLLCYKYIKDEDTGTGSYQWVESDNIFDKRFTISNSDPITLMLNEVEVNLIPQPTTEPDQIDFWSNVSDSKRYDGLYPPFNDENYDKWNNWIPGVRNLVASATNSEVDAESVLKAIVFKANNILKVSKAISCANNPVTLNYSVYGGSDPTIYLAYPDYTEINEATTDLKKLNKYISEDSNITIQGDKNYPTVINTNYCVQPNKFNNTVGKREYKLDTIFNTTELGNYAGAIDTNNPKKTSPKDIFPLKLSNLNTNMSNIKDSNNTSIGKTKYFKVHTVDKRLDFDLHVVKYYPFSAYTEDGNVNFDNKLIIDSANTTFFGGIAMAYTDDEERNIIAEKNSGENVEYTYVDGDYQSLENTYDTNTTKRRYYNMAIYTDTDAISGMNLQEEKLLEDGKNYGFPTFKFEENLLISGRPSVINLEFTSCSYGSSVSVNPVMGVDEEGEQFIESYTIIGEAKSGETVDGEICGGTCFASLYDSFDDMLHNGNDDWDVDCGFTDKDNSKINKWEVAVKKRIKADEVTDYNVYTIKPLSIQADNLTYDDDIVTLIKNAYANATLFKETGIIIPEDSKDYYAEGTSGELSGYICNNDGKAKAMLPDDEELRNDIKYAIRSIKSGGQRYYPIVKRTYIHNGITTTRLARKITVYEVGEFIEVTRFRWGWRKVCNYAAKGPKLVDGLYDFGGGKYSYSWKKYCDENSKLPIPTEERTKDKKKFCYLVVAIPLLKENGAKVTDENGDDVPDVVRDDNGNYLLGCIVDGKDEYSENYRVNNRFYGGEEYAVFIIPFYTLNAEDTPDDGDSSEPVIGEDGEIEDEISYVLPTWYKKKGVTLIFQRKKDNLIYKSYSASSGGHGDDTKHGIIHS